MEETEYIPKEIVPIGIIHKRGITTNQKTKCRVKHNKLIQEERAAKDRVSKVEIVVVKKSEKEIV